MELTPKQKEGLEIAVDRYKANKKYTCIAGYAGTGKSTLVSFIINALPVDPNKVAYVAYTGKAANVLKHKGCEGATTAHKLIYYSRLMPNGKYRYEPKKRLDDAYDVIVVDEVSMLPKEMWERIISYGVYVLACGDPGQLPPIDKDQDNHLLDQPHIFLDEIMRQAAESEIIRLSMHIREGKPLLSFKSNAEQVQIHNKTNQQIGEMCKWADQILCATNRQRLEINNYMRQSCGYSGDPKIGDKIISLSNHWDTLSDDGTALTNGTIGYITDIYKDVMYLPRWVYPDGVVDILRIDMETENGEIFKDLCVDYNCFTTGTPTLSPQQLYKLKKSNKDLEPPYEFTYGYAITTHRAQGSEWNKILIMEDRFPFDKEEHSRWLYTAVTRGAEKAVVISK